MNCPVCNEELRLPAHVLRNMARYNKGLKIVAPCCGHMLMCRPYMRFKADPVYGNTPGEDDWGHAPTRTSMPDPNAKPQH